MTTLLTTPEVETVQELPDRCDSCNAAAKLVVSLTTGGELAFCGHHANRHAGKLLPLAAGIRVEEGFDWAGTA
jgi:hypothetical protein